MRLHSLKPLNEPHNLTKMRGSKEQPKILMQPTYLRTSKIISDKPKLSLKTLSAFPTLMRLYISEKSKIFVYFSQDEDTLRSVTATKYLLSMPTLVGVSQTNEGIKK